MPRWWVTAVAALCASLLRSFGAQGQQGYGWLWEQHTHLHCQGKTSLGSGATVLP